MEAFTNKKNTPFVETEMMIFQFDIVVLPKKKKRKNFVI